MNEVLTNNRRQLGNEPGHPSPDRLKGIEISSPEVPIHQGGDIDLVRGIGQPYLPKPEAEPEK